MEALSVEDACFDMTEIVDEKGGGREEVGVLGEEGIDAGGDGPLVGEGEGGCVFPGLG